MNSPHDLKSAGLKATLPRIKIINDHLVCMQCGRVEEFYDAEIEKRQHRIAHDRGFAISEHALYLYADCTKVRCPHKKGAPS